MVSQKSVNKNFGEKSIIFFGVVSGFLLCAMMMVVVVDACGRKLFNVPIHGSYEIVSFILSLFFFISICYCGFKKGHLTINLITSYLKPRVRQIIQSFMFLLSAPVCWLLSWRLVIYGIGQQGTTGKDLTFLPVSPFIWIAAFFMLGAGFAFLVHAFDLRKTVRDSEV